MQDYPGPSHMIWTGNPGVGKSTAAKIVARYYKSLNIFFGDEPVFVDASSLIGQYVGQSQGIVNDKMDEAIRKNTVLVIDEAHQLIDGMHGGNYGKSIIDAMMGRMEESRNCFNVIFIMYREYYEDFLKINPGMPSRTITFDFADYDANALLEIFKSMCKKTQDKCDEEVLKVVFGFFEELVANGTVQRGNARIARQLLDAMRKKRFKRLLSEHSSIEEIACEEMVKFIVADVPEEME